MKKVVRLSESDITRIVNKVINEQQDNRTGELYKTNHIHFLNK
jgi:hypothetical protein